MVGPKAVAQLQQYNYNYNYRVPEPFHDQVRDPSPCFLIHVCYVYELIKYASYSYILLLARLW